MRLSPLLLLALALPACAGRLDAAVRQQAAADFQCGEPDIKLQQQASAGYVASYSASGCGKEGVYQGNCSLFGCRAYPAGAAAPPPGDAGAYAGDPYAGGGASEPTSAPSSAPSSGPSFPSNNNTSSAPPQPAAPTIVSVTIRSACSKTVRVFYGDKPKFGSGTTSSISSNSVQSKSMKPGEMIWVVDEQDNPLGGVSISEGTRTVEIGSDCNSIRPR